MTKDDIINALQKSDLPGDARVFIKCECSLPRDIESMHMGRIVFDQNLVKGNVSAVPGILLRAIKKIKEFR